MTPVFLRWFGLLLLLLPQLALADEVAEAKKRWAESPHGPMLERILPPTFEARQLPEPGSSGARLVLQYCVQCHNLPNPAMHHAAKWPGIVERMVPRMQGKGNMGTRRCSNVAQRRRARRGFGRSRFRAVRGGPVRRWLTRPPPCRSPFDSLRV